LEPAGTYSQVRSAPFCPDSRPTGAEDVATLDPGESSRSPEIAGYSSRRPGDLDVTSSFDVACSRPAGTGLRPPKNAAVVGETIVEAKAPARTLANALERA
jgi:hypothetical protein